MTDDENVPSAYRAARAASDDRRPEVDSKWRRGQAVVRARRDSAAANRPCSDDALGTEFDMQGGSISEYRRIGETVTLDLLAKAIGLAEDAARDEGALEHILDGLTKTSLLRVARAEPERRVEQLREELATCIVAGSRRARRVRRSAVNRIAGDVLPPPRFTYDSLRTRGAFAMKLSHPVTSHHYPQNAAQIYLRDLEPMVALLAQIVSPDALVFRPTNPNLPGDYVLIRKSPSVMTSKERKQCVRELKKLAAEIAGTAHLTTKTR